MTTMDDRERNEVDERIAQMLRELDPGSAMDDLRFERLARRIAASATQEMQRRTQAVRVRHTVRWRGRLISASLAVVVALGLIFVHSHVVGRAGTSWRLLITSAEQEATRDERGDLFAASIGAVSEHDFIVNLLDQMDTEALLVRSERQ